MKMYERSLIKSILFYVYGYFIHVYLNYVHIWCLQSQTKTWNPLELESQKVVSWELSLGLLVTNHQVISPAL